MKYWHDLPDKAKGMSLFALATKILYYVAIFAFIYHLIGRLLTRTEVILITLAVGSYWLNVWFVAEYWRSHDD